MDLTALLLQLLAGAAGGNAAGIINKARSLGPVLNTILGAVGGLGGGQIAANFMGGGTGAEVGMSAVVGAVLPLIAGMFKKQGAPS